MLIKIASTAVNPADPDIAAGAWDEFFPQRNKLEAKTGFEFSGVVAQDSSHFQEGDKVYGYIDVFSGGNWSHQSTSPSQKIA